MTQVQNAEYIEIAKTICAEADKHGYAAIQEGAVWLSTSQHLIEQQEKMGESGCYREKPDLDFSTSPYWIEMLEAFPVPVSGPEDEDLFSFFMNE